MAGFLEKFKAFLLHTLENITDFDVALGGFVSRKALLLKFSKNASTLGFVCGRTLDPVCGLFCGKFLAFLHQLGSSRTEFDRLGFRLCEVTEVKTTSDGLFSFLRLIDYLSVCGGNWLLRLTGRCGIIPAIHKRA